jgi:PAS domain S-box-containing protein
MAIFYGLQVLYVSPMLARNDFKDLAAYQHSVADHIAQFINLELQEYIVELEGLARMPGIVAMQTEETDRVLTQMNALTQSFDYFFVTDTDGRWVSYPSNPDLVGKKIRNDYWLQEILAKNKTTYLDIHRAQSVNTLVSGFATPITNSQGKVVGILRGVITISEDNPLLKMIRSFTFIENGRIFLVDANGRPLAHPDFILNFDSFENYDLTSLPPVQKSLAGEAGIVEYTDNNAKYIASYRPLATTGWGLVVQQPLDDIVLHIKNEIASITYSHFLFLFIALLISGFIVFKSLTPLTKLLKSLQNQNIKPAPNYPDDEIGLLAKEIENLFTQINQAKQDLGDTLKNQEQVIKARTKELVASNEKLGSEVQDRIRSEKSLRESEERYRSLFENATDLIQVVRPDGQLLYVNPSWSKALGYSEDEARGLKVFDITHRDCADKCRLNFEKTVTEGTSGIIEIIFKSKDGGKVFLQGSANYKPGKEPHSFVYCIFQNVTDRRLMEEELIKMHKLESIGLLAGGIAHDFNNILTAVIGNLSLVRAQTEPGSNIYNRIEQAEKASFRARDLTQQLLTFSRGGEPIKKTILLGEIVKDSCQFVLRGSNVNCNYEIAEDLWLIEADESQINQVIQNIIINADQAMPDGGTINVRLENVHIGSEDLQPLGAGKYVLITAEDQGLGISEKHLKRIFDPYFSTKQKGHGLGLATAYSISKNHGGLLAVESKQGVGSIFKLYLPASRKKDGGRPSARKDIHFGKGSILLMDDEEHVRETAAEILGHLGYQVTTVSEGGQAIEKYGAALREDKPFDIVILDLTVPGGLGGKETIEKLLEIDPAGKVIVSSGYANNPVMADYKSYGFSAVVPKPYKIEDISKTIKELLNP